MEQMINDRIAELATDWRKKHADNGRTYPSSVLAHTIREEMSRWGITVSHLPILKAVDEWNEKELSPKELGLQVRLSLLEAELK